MIVNSPSSNINREMQSAASVGLMAGILYAGFELLDQRRTKNSDLGLAALSKDVFEKTVALEQNKETKGFFDKIFNFFDKQELKIKEDKLLKLSQGKYALKALTSKTIVGIIEMTLFSLGISAIMSLFQKNNSNLQNVNNK